MFVRAPVADICDLGELNFETVGDSEDIPPLIITDLVQDTSGFLWIGTLSGLVRFDGYRYRRFSHLADDPHSLGGNHIQALALAPDGRLWIGTLADDLSIYDPNTESFVRYRHEKGNPNSLSSNKVWSIVADPHWGIWIGTSAGLNHFDPQTGSFKRYQHDSGDSTSVNSNQINTLLVDAQQNLWVGSLDGLNRMSVGNDTFERVGDELNRQSVFRLFQSRDGKVWIGTLGGGLNRYNPGNTAFRTLRHSPGRTQTLSDISVFSMLALDDGQVWVGTQGNGIDIIDPKKGRFDQFVDEEKPDKPLVIKFDHLALQSDGVLWAGSDDGALVDENLNIIKQPLPMRLDIIR